MDLFLLHSLLLLWASLGAARRLNPDLGGQILAAALLAWGNVVVTSLVLSIFLQLGEPGLFFVTSTLLAVLTPLMAILILPGTSGTEAPVMGPGDKPHPWLVGAFLLTITPLAFAHLAVACAYLPNSADAHTYQLPRAMYYLGQGSLAPFHASDSRQVFLPFNYNLLQAFGLIYRPALPVLHLFNFAAWAVSGIAVYRLCRLSAVGVNAALVACWLALTALPVLAQTATTTPELPAAAALLCTLVFALQWVQTRRFRDALLTGLAAGLAAGSALTMFCLATLLALLGLALAYHGWRHHETHRWASLARTWSLPLLVALGVGTPFALLNLTGDIPWRTHLHLNQSFLDGLHQIWTGFVPLPAPPSPLRALNEDTAGFGFTGPLMLMAAVLALWGHGRSVRSTRWLAGLGLGCGLVSLLLSDGIPFSARNLAPAFFLLCPCLAAVIDAGRAQRPAIRYAGRVTLLIVLLTTGWSAVVYTLRNTHRPLLPLLDDTFLPPTLSEFPLPLQLRLSGQPLVNIDTDGINERIFAFMTHRSDQRFTSHDRIKPIAYNLLSRSTLSRHAAYQDIALLPTYTLVPVANKRTAGVEFLATLDAGGKTRDYFEVKPLAGQTTPIGPDQNLLVTLYPAPGGPGATAHMLIKVSGLNPEDQALLAVTGEQEDGSAFPLASFNADGATTIPLDHVFHRLAFRVFAEDSGAEIGAAVIPRQSPTVVPFQRADPGLPTNDQSLFVTELVRTQDASPITVEGLQPVEGPFPQWDLPLIRWARQPSTLITLPPTDQFAHLQLSFGVRLHVRRKGSLEILFNGELVQRFRIDSQTTWLEETVELTPRAGANVLEFRDVPLNHEPDWVDYLERYPDVKKHLFSNHIPLEQGAREHYEMHGRAEGRTMLSDDLPAVPADSYYFMFRSIRLEGFKSR